MTPNNNYFPLPLRPSRRHQHRNRKFVSEDFIIPMKNDSILPFQLEVPPVGGVFSCVLKRISDQVTVVDLSSNISVIDKTDYYLVVYDSEAAGLSLPYGHYEVHVTTPSGTFYSDSIGVGTYDLVKISYWHSKDFILHRDDLVIDYTTAPYKNFFYVKGHISRPSYPSVENDTQNRSGVDFPGTRSSAKRYILNFLGTEGMLDFMRLIWMHDYIIINDGDYEYQVDKFQVTIEEWVTMALADINIEFTIGTVVSNIGKGYGVAPQGDYDPTDYNDDYN